MSGLRCIGFTALVLLSALLLAGCAAQQTTQPNKIAEDFTPQPGQETDTTPKEAVYGMFHTPSDHVEDLMEQGDLLGASKVYQSQKPHFQPPSKDGQGSVDKLSRLFSSDSDDAPKVAAMLGKALAEQYEPEVNSALQKLNLVQWPDSSRNWGEIKESLDNTRRLTAEMDSHTVMAETKNPPLNYKRLKARLTGLDGDIRTAAPKMFSEYPLDQEPNFFSIYPVFRSFW